MKILLLLALVYGCGAPEKTPAEETPPDKGGIVYQPEDKEKTVVVEYHKEGDRTALALEDTADLPECTLANERQLAWIKRTEQFFACTDGEWAEVPVAGKDGDEGAAGKDGEAGAQGPAGEPGPQGEPGRPAAPNEWTDPATDNRWFFGLASVHPDHAGEICVGAWRLPTSAEASQAVAHGLLLASALILGPKGVWSSELALDVDGATRGREFVGPSSYPGIAGESVFPGGVYPGVACIAEEAP